MMRDFIYDLKRTLTGKFTIIMIVLVILLSVGVAYAFISVSSTSPSSAPPSATATVIPDIYPVHGGYEISDFVVNGYGKPVAGLAINSNITNMSSKTPTVIRQLDGVTNSGGFVSFYYPTTEKNITYNYYLKYVYGKGTIRSSASLFSINSKSQFLPGINSGSYSSTFPNIVYLIPVHSSSSDLRNSFLIYYAGPNTTHPPSLSIYYNYSASYNFFSSSTITKTNMTHYKTISNTNYSIIALPINNSADDKYINIAVFNSSGDFLVSDTAYFSVTNSSVIIDAILQVPYEYLLPILGIFSAYFYYGKDKASGVLESVIVRPVTKGRIFVSRFFASSVSFFVSLIVSLALIDLIVHSYTGTLLSSRAFVSILLGYLAVAIAYAGIIYLVSQFTKSQGVILGIGIGIFFLFVLFWSGLVYLVAFAAHINLAIAGTYKWILVISALSPSFIPTMAIDLRAGLYTSDGISLASVILVGLIWACVPAILSFYFARKRD